MSILIIYVLINLFGFGIWMGIGASLDTSWEFYDWWEEGFKKGFSLLHLLTFLIFLPLFTIFFIFWSLDKLIQLCKNIKITGGNKENE